MSLFRFIFRSLIYFRRQHFALLAGTLVATAVLTGALIIGDSVRFSLQKNAETRLGSIRYSITTGGRFIRSELAGELSAALQAPASAVLMLQGIAVNQDTNDRINRVQVVGVDSSFWNFAEVPLVCPGTGEAILSESTASILGLKTGDALLLRLEQTSLIPINAPFSPGNKSSIAFRLIVRAIADDQSLGRFSLKSNQIAPFSVFIDREILAERLDLNGLANFILIGENNNKDLNPEKISTVFAGTWKPLDAGLRVHYLTGTGKYDLVSNRVFIDKTISDNIEKITSLHENILTYLVNSIRVQSKSTPYSFIVAAPSQMLPGDLKPGEIVINQWLANDLRIQPGDSISLDFFVIGPFRKLNEKSRDFMVKYVVPTSGTYTDSTLMPDFPGLSDAGSCRDWNTGIPIDLKRIRDKDEEYWDRYRGTPKALICLSEGTEMWTNPFGQYTSVRFSNETIQPDSLLNTLMRKLRPENLGLIVIPVYSEGLTSAGNSVDFGQLFLGLSFFIIVAGLLLIILIFSLNAASRSSEIALLSGLGIPPRLILRISLAESFVVILTGSILGAICGIFYNLLLVKALNSIWQGAVQTNTLEIHVKSLTFLSGAGIGFFIAFLTIILITRRKLKEQVAGLIKGSYQFSAFIQNSFSIRNRNLSFAAILSSALLTSYSLLSGAYEDPALFLSAAASFLFGSIFGIAWIIEKMQNTNDFSRFGIFFLALKNAGRNKRRSLTVVLLLAIGVFSIVLTGAYRRTYSGTEGEIKSGTGGYLFWVETSLVIPDDLNDTEIQNKYLVTNKPFSGEIHFEQFLSLDGDDASCLNLNQVNRPRILGVDAGAFEKHEAFSFNSLLNEDAKNNPWAELKKNLGKDIVPAFADQSVIQYGLKCSVGDTLLYLNENGREIKIILAGGLENSIFQGNLLIDKEQFLQHFPSAGGSRVMLIDAHQNEEKMISDVLTKSLADYGIEISKASARLAAFNTVENTYLSVFMILGGLGLVIGTFGLAIVFFRNILERRHEFAILSALGLKNRQIISLIITENTFLFLSGIATGLGSALISILPSLLSPEFHTQILPILVILLVVIFSGIFWIWILARRALKANTFDALRND